jgi:Uma2 family endonuclease
MANGSRDSALSSLLAVPCSPGKPDFFFVLKHMLGYPDVLWYDAEWTEWSAQRELPVEG